MSGDDRAAMGTRGRTLVFNEIFLATNRRTDALRFMNWVLGGGAFAGDF